MTRVLGVLILVTALAACGGTGDDAAEVGATTPAGVTIEPSTTTSEPAAATTSTVPAPATAATPPTTVPPSTAPRSVPTSAAPTTEATPCDGTDGPIVTASGRTVTLRTAGIARAAPTLLVIHGFTGTPTGIERIADLTVVATSAGIAVAYPEGTPVEPGGYGWNTGASVFATSGVDDAAAIAEMIDAIVATGCVDRGRVTITGESNGAGMTLAALCAPGLAGAFRSAVMVIPAIDDGVLERCAGNGAPDTPLTAVIGGIDTTTPVAGGNGLLPQRAWFDQVAAWRGCIEVGAPAALSPLVESVTGRGCASCTELVTVADGPHTWPGTPEGNGGSTPGTFDLNRRIVADVLAPEPGCLSER